MLRKHQNSQQKGGAKNKDLQDQSFIPKDLGRASAKITKMSTDEVEEVHKTHKRQKIDKGIEVMQRNEFEINLEVNDDDEDNFGPKLDLFMGNEDESHERNRK